MKKAQIKVKRIRPTIMSDSECYLRVGVPDGLNTDQKGTPRYGIVQDVTKSPAIPHNRKGRMGKKGGCY